MSGQSGCWPVLVDKSGAGRGPLDRLAEVEHRRVSAVAGCSLVQASVGSVIVVLFDVLVEAAMELALVPDQGAVKKFVADGCVPSAQRRRLLGERLAEW